MRPPRVAWFHCFSGISGDMALASLIDAGADVDEIASMVASLGTDGWSLTAEGVLRGGIAATRAVVTTKEDQAPTRTYADISALITAADLPRRVATRSQAVFTAIAVAEARIHAQPVADVHFHEVGGLDSIVDVVGTAAALELLGVDEVRASPVAVGLGTVGSAHGLLPNPAPAVSALLVGIPAYGRDTGVELTTPTGAGILAAMSEGFGPLPPMVVSATGYGAGASDPDGLPNLVQVVLGSSTSAGGPAVDLDPGGVPALVMSVNVDDVTGEVLAHTVGALMAAGAHDAWVTPIVMKKGRPAHTVSALADPALAAQVAQVLAKETGSLGLRMSRTQRWLSRREVETVNLDGLPVRVKVSPGRVKAEHDDAAAVAASRGLPLRQVLAEAEQKWLQGQAESGTGRG
ncbi:MAG: nickel pincer cofactor biosynthesis protein LarC [Acidimicrobiales bacterium]